MNLTDDQLDRATGVLLATAAGDALGAGYEFTYPTAATTIDMVGGGPFGWAPGEWTDDTSMAIAIALAADETGDLTGTAGQDAIARRFVAWYDSRPPDIGNQTASVLSHRSPTGAAMTAVSAGLRGRTGGNGSLMRTAPVALSHLDDADAAVAAAAAVSRLTHSDERAVQACELWTTAIRHAVLHANLDGIDHYLDRAPADVSGYWRPLLEQAETGSPEQFSNNGWVVHALMTAWWAIAGTASSGPQQLPAALELCVRAGNDTDTTAAIAGGLLGARWGATAVPQRWRAILHGYPGLDADGLVALAERIATA
ncbi:ADP-ribosylglycohydrolase family protein [Skermania piniformis]|uniref:ADP-ribosylglycohydrolase family protein n=1 Tax=Skermania pinensis TaxID=39122 RepID=A0ABX8S610_9ACTN|nr:ADP-ribosylglycohydrolase family protein [Skermania piniformis]QXQ13259.1 ADP-ribosylglycohydrolase family protein [Skermania piniformis]